MIELVVSRGLLATVGLTLIVLDLAALYGDWRWARREVDVSTAIRAAAWSHLASHLTRFALLAGIVTLTFAQTSGGTTMGEAWRTYATVLLVLDAGGAWVARRRILHEIERTNGKVRK